jgi:SAM-dependent methyltransferase
MQSPWQKYNEAHKNSPPRPRLLRTLDQFAQTSGQALDIGAGAGRDSLELLRRGWLVTAIESDRASSAALEEIAKDYPGTLKVLAIEMEELSSQFGKFNLINASFSLPFCAPSEFERMWSQLFEMLEPQGILSAEIFGERDDWNKAGTGLSFCTRQQAESLLSPYEVLHFEEVEEKKSAFSGAHKAWHYFSVIARKPLVQK